MTSEVMLCHRCGASGDHERVTHASAAAAEQLGEWHVMAWRDRLLVAAWRCLRCGHARTRHELCPYGCDDLLGLRSDGV